MRIIGTVGLPGSGKGEAAGVAHGEDIPVVTMGDVVRDACRERGLDPAQHHGDVAQALREEEGPAAIADRSIPRVKDATDADVVLVDGLRSPVEVERFREAFGTNFIVVAIEAPFDLRADRLGARGRDESDLSVEQLRTREQRELDFGMREVIENADVTIENTGSLESFRDRVRTLLREGPEALRA